MSVQKISTLSILGKVLPKTNCPECSKRMALRGSDKKDQYYHLCSCGYRVEIDISSDKVKKLIASYH